MSFPSSSLMRLRTPRFADGSMSPLRANRLGVNAEDCKIITESYRHGNDWVVFCEGTVLTQGTIFYTTDWLRRLRGLNSTN